MVATGKPVQSVGCDELLCRARAGDAEAFCKLAAQHEPRLLQEAHGLCHDSAAAEELVSETLLEAWRSLGRYNRTCRLSTWLFSILLHRYHKHLRRARSRPLLLAQFSPSDAEARQLQENLPADGLSPSQAVEQQELSAQLRAAVESLPEKHRQVVLLRFFEDASLREIAALAGCSVGTVKSRLHYGLEKLREMKDALNLCEPARDKQM